MPSLLIRNWASRTWRGRKRCGEVCILSWIPQAVQNLAQLSPSSLLSRWHEHRNAGCRIKKTGRCWLMGALKCPMPRHFGAPWAGSWAVQTPFPGVYNMATSRFCMQCCSKEAAGLRFGAAMNAQVFCCTSPFSPCFYGIPREAEQGCQHGENSLAHIWWRCCARVLVPCWQDPLCRGSCAAALRDKSR